MTNQAQGPGLIFVLVGPTAVGKNTIMKKAIPRVQNLRQLPTATTRKPRAEEEEGQQHYFQSSAGFDQLIQDGALLEWQLIHKDRYGIIRATVEEAIATQDDMVADIDVLGAEILKQEFPHNSVLVFIAPPHPDAIPKRLDARKESKQEITRRLQRVNFEMQYAPICDYLIVNDDLDTSIQQFISIVLAERSRRNINNTRVAALFMHNDFKLVSTSDGEHLPSMLVGRNETAQEAVLRLARNLKLDDVTINPQPGAPEDGTAPFDYSVSMADGNAAIELVYACEVHAENVDFPPSGWKWVHTGS